MKAKLFYVVMALVIAPMTGFVAAAVPAISAQSPADSVDIGNTTSESGHDLIEWGPIMPPPGNWGGFKDTGEMCRPTWHKYDKDATWNGSSWSGSLSGNYSWATFTLNTSSGMTATTLKLRVLDGTANDSFKVYVNNNLVYTYSWSGDPNESWVEHTIPLSGLSGTLTVKINCTGAPWSQWDQYGQLGVDWAELYAEEAEGCFIATAAYGTSTAGELDVLRAFRDQVLLESPLGSQFVAWYYQVSPPVADFISEHNLLRTVVRELLIDPVVSLAEFTEGMWGD